MVARRTYVPAVGDLIWIDFDPQTGREQRGRRPVIVLSPLEYNDKVGLAIVCPVTSHAKGYPFEVALAPGSHVSGVALADHVKSLDWRQRRAERAGRISDSNLREIQDKLGVLLGIR